METEYNEIRFGVLAVKKGFVTPEQVVKALSIQVTEDLNTGEHRPIGTIMLDQQLITEQQIEEVLNAMNGENNQS